jgi:hypothetical protein
MRLDRSLISLVSWVIGHIQLILNSSQGQSPQSRDFGISSPTFAGSVY